MVDTTPVVSIFGKEETSMRKPRVRAPRQAFLSGRPLELTYREYELPGLF